MSDENEQHENDSQADASNADETVDFEPLTATYERLRHSTDSAALSEFARRPLPDRSDQAAFSRATALLEAVAGKAVAGNADDKNWLVGRLTKDESPEVRATALRNKRTSWKMRLEGAEDSTMDSDTLDFLGSLGTQVEPDAPVVLATMVRRAVALNPNVSDRMLQQLAQDASSDVQKAAQRQLAEK